MLIDQSVAVPDVRQARRDRLRVELHEALQLRERAARVHDQVQLRIAALDAQLQLLEELHDEPLVITKEE